MKRIVYFGMMLNAYTAQGSQIMDIPLTVQKQMMEYSYHQGCPVEFKDLSLIKVDYWGYDNKSHIGDLVVNKELAQEVQVIFDALYQHHFPIQDMQLIDKFKGDDMTAMQNNVTSAYNCRAITGKPGTFSQHSYGRAIDINPLINPYVKGEQVLPPEGKPYVDRAIAAPGKITKDSLIYQLFTEHGWDWGGSWPDLQDYQHFEKRSHGEKRKPG